MRHASHVARIRRGMYNILVGNPERVRPLSIALRLCKDNIKIDLKWHAVANTLIIKYWEAVE
jgi:hypothetical protein